MQYTGPIRVHLDTSLNHELSKDLTVLTTSFSTSLIFRHTYMFTKVFLIHTGERGIEVGIKSINLHCEYNAHSSPSRSIL